MNELDNTLDLEELEEVAGGYAIGSAAVNGTQIYRVLRAKTTEELKDESLANPANSILAEFGTRDEAIIYIEQQRGFAPAMNPEGAAVTIH
ncbi:MAG: hypothetical protein J6X33_07175 [Clostridiales bacterium]|nr:hypothetical protein [Clostridiales bacterium]